MFIQQIKIRGAFLAPSMAGVTATASSSSPSPSIPPNSSTSLAKPPGPQRTIWIKPSSRSPKKRLQHQYRKNGSRWDERKLVGFVDYDKGERRVSIEVAGARKDEIPARYRLRVEGSRWQKDWKLSEVVDQVLELDHWEDIDGILNRWAGRFARKNFPLLIRVFAVLLRVAFFFFFFFFPFIYRKGIICVRTASCNTLNTSRCGIGLVRHL